MSIPMAREMLELRLKVIEQELETIPGDIEIAKKRVDELQDRRSQLIAERQDIAPWLATGRVPI